jgi:hypothetical protein
MKAIKFPDIKRFRDAYEKVKRTTQYIGQDENDNPIYDETIKIPTLYVVGTEKLHGTNASIVLNNNEIKAQSKTNIIDIENDNAGFAFYVEKNKEYFKNLLKSLSEKNNIDLKNNSIVLYGEWCGKGIQKRMAINELDKMFVVFGLKVKPIDNTSYWIDFSEVRNHDIRLFNIKDYKIFEMDIDFSKPEESLKEIEKLTLEVENESPFGKAFGVSGLGEGIVWKIDQEINNKKYNITFKSKGEKHSGKGAKKPKKVDKEKQNLINEVAYKCLPNWRLEQIYNETFDILNGGKADIKGTGKFLKNIVKDIHKEELLTIADAGLEPKEINSTVSNIARKWFFEQINSF